MAKVKIDSFKKNILSSFHKIKEGKTILILTRDNKPFAELRPVSKVNRKRTSKRPSGLCKGEFIVPDDFDAPLPKNLLKPFKIK
jgi:antitoxin (DNA-binding transcriptional repressor) of toxin-antitoxin stability system